TYCTAGLSLERSRSKAPSKVSAVRKVTIPSAVANRLVANISPATTSIDRNTTTNRRFVMDNCCRASIEDRHCWLLCARRKRPCRRAAEQRDELASSQMIELHSVPASAELHDIELAGISQGMR